MADIPRPHIADYAGRRLGRYDVLELIERTHLAVSYKGGDSETGLIVTLTVLNAESPMPAERRQRFRQECSLVARLNHPAIHKLLAYYDEEELPFMVLADLEGQVLSERLGKPWPYEIALPLLDDLAEGLDSAHRGGVIHRAFGPDRVVMRSNETPLITGFALPRILGLESQIARDATALAPVEYLSPEQLRGQPADARSDIYAFAVVAYEMLAGEPPFSGNPDQISRAHQNDAPRDLRSVNPAVPAWVGAAIARAMEKDPRNRFQGIGQFADALRRNEALATPASQTGGDGPGPTRLPSLQHIGDRQRSLPIGLIAIGVALVVALAAFGLTFFLLGDDDGDEQTSVVDTPSATATATVDPSATVTATTTPGGELGLAVGDTVTVQNTETGLRLREEPAGEQIGLLPDGTTATLIGGPTVANELTWWQVESSVGSGWVAEAAQGVVFLAAAPAPSP